MQDVLERALSLMGQIHERIVHINTHCASLDLPCGWVPLRLRYCPTLLRDNERSNVFHKCYLRFRWSFIGNYLVLETLHTGRIYRDLPLVGSKAELFVQRIHPDYLPQLVTWLSEVEQWLNRRQSVIDRLAARKMSTLHGRVGWFRALLMWLDEKLLGETTE